MQPSLYSRVGACRRLRRSSPKSRRRMGPERDALELHELGQKIVEVPGAARDVEDRIRPLSLPLVVERVVEGGHALKRQAGVGVPQEDRARHGEALGHPGLQHRVVDVADDAEAGGRRRHHHRAHGAHRRSRPGMGQGEVHPMPEPGGLRRRGRRDLEPEVPLLVGDRLALPPAEMRHHPGAAHLVALEALPGVAEVPPDRVPLGGIPDRLVLEHAPLDQQALGRAETPVGKDLDRVVAVVARSQAVLHGVEAPLDPVRGPQPPAGAEFEIVAHFYNLPVPADRNRLAAPSRTGRGRSRRRRARGRPRRWRPESPRGRRSSRDPRCGARPPSSCLPCWAGAMT